MRTLPMWNLSAFLCAPIGVGGAGGAKDAEAATATEDFAWGARKRPTSAAAPRQRSMPPTIAPGSRSRTVSYTHLRAHETSAHL
eukprot:1375862-Alexandrium_andersonii.AAC.1